MITCTRALKAQMVKFLPITAAKYTTDSPTLAPYISFYLYARLETEICNEKINPVKNFSYTAQIKEAL